MANYYNQEDINELENIIENNEIANTPLNNCYLAFIKFLIKSEHKDYLVYSLKDENIDPKLLFLYNNSEKYNISKQEKSELTDIRLLDFMFQVCQNLTYIDFIDDNPVSVTLNIIYIELLEEFYNIVNNLIIESNNMSEFYNFNVYREFILDTIREIKAKEVKEDLSEEIIADIEEIISQNVSFAYNMIFQRKLLKDFHDDKLKEMLDTAEKDYNESNAE